MFSCGIVLLPTVAPTESCKAITMTGTQTGYDGKYNLVGSQMNGKDWWQSRNDVGDVRLFYYQGALDSRWRLEGDNYGRVAITMSCNLKALPMKSIVNDSVQISLEPISTLWR